MEPIQFKPLYFEKVWGGQGLQAFRNDVPQGAIGESWDVTCHPNGMSVVAAGEFAGQTFAELIEQFGSQLVGTKVSTADFPLLLKVITAEENLSIQVHPGDEYAKEHEGQLGKTEAWYVLNATPEATLTIGVDSESGAEFRQALKDGGDLTPYLQTVSVTKGDCFLIPSGCVHAIGAGVTIIEIQQSSDVTYRLYDYGRPREIHVEQGLSVTDVSIQVPNLRHKSVVTHDGYTTQLFCENDYFGLERIVVHNVCAQKTDFTRFEILTCVSGEITLANDTFKATLVTGDSYLLPASLGEYQLQGNGEVLRSYPVV